MSLANDLSILFIFSKNQLLVLLILAMVSFASFSFISALIFMMSFLLLELVTGSFSLVAEMVKHLPVMWETQVQCLGPEDPLEKEMTSHSITLDWKIPWMEEPGRLQSMGCKELDMTEQLHFLSYVLYICTCVLYMYMWCVYVCMYVYTYGVYVSL